MPKLNHDTAVSLIMEVDDYELECNDAEYTDTGALWDLVYKLRDTINTTLPVSVQFPFKLKNN